MPTKNLAQFCSFLFVLSIVFKNYKILNKNVKAVIRVVVEIDKQENKKLGLDS